MALLVAQKAESFLTLHHKQAVTPIMVVIQNRHWGMVIRRALTERCRSGLNKSDGYPARFRLFQFNGNSRLSIFAKLKCSRIGRWPWIPGEHLLVFFQFLRRILRTVCPLIEPAQLVMGRGMLGLELQHSFKRVNRLLNLPEPFLSQTELEVQCADCGIDFLRLLKSLDRLLCLIQ